MVSKTRAHALVFLLVHLAIPALNHRVVKANSISTHRLKISSIKTI